MKTTSVPKNIHIGAGTIAKLPELLEMTGKKVLLVHGHRPVEDGLLAKVRSLLIKSGFPFADMGQILPNPKFKSVLRGIQIAKKENCDIILALGGGSTLQCAKGIALGLHARGNIWDYWKGKKKPGQIAPVAAVMTNPGSGSELGDACTLVRKGKRRTVHLPGLVCKFAILDPELSQYPVYPTMNQIFAIFEHLFTTVMEAPEYLDQAAAMSSSLIETADALTKNISDLSARTKLFETGLEAHASLPHVHGAYEDLVDSLSYSCSLVQGSAASAVFKSWISLMDQKEKETLLAFARKVFDDPAIDDQQAEARFDRVMNRMGMPLSLCQAGLLLSKKKIHRLAQNKLEEKVLLLAAGQQSSR